MPISARGNGSQAFVARGSIRFRGIHPAELSAWPGEGLAQRGVANFQHVRAAAAARDGRVVATPQGAVRARQVIIATNSYSDLTPATRHMQHTLVRSAARSSHRRPPHTLPAT